MLNDEDDDDFDGVYQEAYLSGYSYAVHEHQQGYEYNPDLFDDDDFSLEHDAWWDGYEDYWSKVMDIEYE